jgi:hypothetical protein
MIRIGNELEKEYGTRPRMDEIFRLQSIEALAYYYQEKLNSPQPLSTDTADSQTAALIHRIKNLSREEVQSLLEAKRKRNESIT